MIRPEDIGFELRTFERVFVIKAGDLVLQKVAFEVLDSLKDRVPAEALFEGIRAIMNDLWPAGEPLVFHKDDDGNIKLVM